MSRCTDGRPARRHRRHDVDGRTALQQRHAPWRRRWRNPTVFRFHHLGAGILFMSKRKFVENLKFDSTKRIKVADWIKRPIGGAVKRLTHSIGSPGDEWADAGPSKYQTMGPHIKAADSKREASLRVQLLPPADKDFCRIEESPPTADSNKSKAVLFWVAFSFNYGLVGWILPNHFWVRRLTPTQNFQISRQVDSRRLRPDASPDPFKLKRRKVEHLQSYRMMCRTMKFVEN